MKMKHFVSRLTAGIACAALVFGLTLPARAAAPAETIRVDSYKGNSLDVGERSSLIISPSGTEYTVTSSDPDTVAVEQVAGFWVAVAKSEGTAEITAANRAGESGTLTLTVGTAADPAAPASTDTEGQPENLDVRQELIQLINQTRVANGAAELPVSEALMTAAQACSDRQYTYHHNQEECEAVTAYGYPHGFGSNLTVFTSVATEHTAQHALDNWIKAPGHFQAMIDPKCDSIGVGVTESGGVTYCYMFVGRPDTINPYG